MIRLIILLPLFLLQLHAAAADKYYVFYLHGRIVEMMGMDAISPEYGKYEYNSILDHLREKNYTVYAEQRGDTPDMEKYAKKIAKQIDSLKKAGIKPGHIAVIGASKGGAITLHVSGIVKDSRVKYVVLGNCISSYKRKLYGKVLQISEMSDAFTKDCEPLPASNGDSELKEIKINTGLEHGFLYKPLHDWLDPAAEWVEQ